ncbi:alpha/beta hydrolase [Sesbania bispinosa]|nr:alpha/beta hydrolase [Sesbania bispinosa]
MAQIAQQDIFLLHPRSSEAPARDTVVHQPLLLQRNLSLGHLSVRAQKRNPCARTQTGTCVGGGTAKFEAEVGATTSFAAVSPLAFRQGTPAALAAASSSLRLASALVSSSVSRPTWPDSSPPYSLRQNKEKNNMSL